METNEMKSSEVRSELSKAFAKAYELADQSFQATREALIIALGEKDAVDYLNKNSTEEFSAYYAGIADAHREALTVEMESRLVKLCPLPDKE